MRRIVIAMLTAWAAVSPVRAQEHGGRPEAAALSRSMHRGLGCASCHGHMGFERGGRLDPVATCGSCHTAQGETFAADGHLLALRAGNASAPSCVSCHGSHDVLSARDPASRTHPANVPAQLQAKIIASARAERAGASEVEEV